MLTLEVPVLSRALSTFCLLLSSSVPSILWISAVLHNHCLSSVVLYVVLVNAVNVLCAADVCHERFLTAAPLSWSESPNPRQSRSCSCVSLIFHSGVLREGILALVYGRRHGMMWFPGAGLKWL